MSACVDRDQGTIMVNKPSGYFDGLNQKLFAALPPARRILELGCANGRLGEAYRMLHPDAEWTGVDCVEEALREAASRLDRTIQLDLDGDGIERLEGAYDLIVFGDLIEHLSKPSRFLRALSDLVSDDGRLVCCIPNMNHVSVIERFLIGDLCYDANGLLDDTHLRLFSPASAVKILLDSGWLPSLVDSYTIDSGGPVFDALRNAARLMGSSDDAFRRDAETYQMIFDCLPLRKPVVPAKASRPSVAVVVPVTNETQLALNLARSPGLIEMGAPLIPIHGAASASEALERGRAMASADWVVFAHQDVYLPEGSGTRLLEEIEFLMNTGRPDMLLGVIGLEEGQGSFGDIEGLRAAGTIVDRGSRMHFPTSPDAITIDECLVILAKDSPHIIDPKLGWHLWATELVWAAQRRTEAPACRIGFVPSFHNSVTPWRLPDDFAASREYLFSKYPERHVLHTLSGSWARSDDVQPWHRRLFRRSKTGAA